jgi:hypothetical protein
MERILSPAIDHVLYCHDRMPVQHPWPGVAHRGPDLLPLFRLVAMHRALGACCLALLKRALLEALPGIVLEHLTFFAQPAFYAMATMAVEPDHRLDGSAFPGNPWVVVDHNPVVSQ